MPFEKVLQAFIDVRCKPNQIDEFRNAFGQVNRGNAAEPAMQVQKFSGRQPFVKAEIFGQEPDLPPNFDVAGRHAQDPGLAAGWFGETQKHFDRSTFPRAIRTEKTEYFAPTHG